MMNKGLNLLPFIELNDVSSMIDGKWVLQNINATISHGERLVIMGETGSGKSTLLKVIAGLEMCDEGAVFVNGKKLKGPQDQLIPGNPGVCYMNQHAILKNNYKVHEILERDRVMAHQEAEQLYQRMGIYHLLDRWSDEVSGGEKQRVLLASLLVSLPEILLLDEPFSNLDQINKSIIKRVLEEFMEQNNMTVILATHDPADVWQWGQTIMILHQGKILEYGKPGEIYHNPANEYVAGLLGEYQIIPLSSSLRYLFNEQQPNSDIIVRSSRFVFTKIKTSNQSLKGRVSGLRYFDHYLVLQIIIDNFILDVTAPITADVGIDEDVFVSLVSIAH